ncbi:hypothetical protein D3C72_2270730 [compost metagenome]
MWGAASIGYLNGPLAWWVWLLVFAAGSFLILALPITDEVGFALGLLVIGPHWWRTRRGRALA